MKCCTRCNRELPIRLGGRLELNVPYQLCGGCVDFYNSLDNDHSVAAFVEDLWRKAANQNVEFLRSLKAAGTA
jgi:hypothetical protein